MVYEYECKKCGFSFIENLTVKDRDEPTYNYCRVCGGTIYRVMNAVPFKVKGANAANGYSDTVGDVEKFTGKPYVAED